MKSGRKKRQSSSVASALDGGNVAELMMVDALRARVKQGEALIAAIAGPEDFEGSWKAQKAILDLLEFLCASESELSVVAENPKEEMAAARETVSSVEDLVEQAKLVLDSRVFSIFMENQFGEAVLSKNGALGSKFSKIKAKVFRGSELSWEKREEIIENLLGNVNEKRRGYLIDGREEVRGYKDMSDKELLGWSMLASELKAGGADSEGEEDQAAKRRKKN